MEILRDQIWQFVGVVFAVIGIIIPLVMSLSEKKRKEFSYEVLESAPMLKVAGRVQEYVKVTFLDEPVSQVQFVSIIFSNTGNVPITASDFEGTIGFTFGESPQILDIDIASKSPQNINAKIQPESIGFSLLPALYNPRDTITINVLLGKFDGNISIEGRITGISEIKRIKGLDDRKVEKQVSLAALMAFYGLGMFFASAQFMAINENIGFTNTLIGGACAIIGMLLVWYNFQKRKRWLREIIKANKWDIPPKKPR
ncbi:MAG: hypothetical protein FJZ98_03885 [Chloroflexi bacterium]|nr:hypothetical protein [Chloroflexota bacterium]